MRTILFILMLSFSGMAVGQNRTALLEEIYKADSNDAFEKIFTLTSEFIQKYPEDSLVIECFDYHEICMGEVSMKNLEVNFYDKALDHIKKADSNDLNNYFDALEIVTKIQISMQNYKRAEVYHLKLLNNAEERSNYERLVTGYDNYGYYFESLGLMDAAILNYKKGLKYIKLAGLEKGIIHIEILQDLARVSEIQHRYEEAESLYKVAYLLSLDTLEEDESIHLGLVNDYAMLFFFTGQYKRALPYLEENYEILKKYNLDIENNTTITGNLADCYAHLGRYEEAEKLYLITEEIERTSEQLSKSFYPVTISRMGDFYGFQGRYEEAKKMHLKAIDLAEKNLVPQDLYFFYILEQAYLFFVKSENWELVRQISIACFEQNCMDNLPASGVLPNIQELAQNQMFATMPYALKALNSTSLGYWQGYLKTKDKMYLESAYSIQLAIKKLLNRLKNTLSAELDKLELLSTTQQISELGIKISNELFALTQDEQYQESAFVFLENNKYVLLQDALQAKSAQSFGDVSPDIIRQEKELEETLLMAKTSKIQVEDLESKKTAMEAYNQAIANMNDFKFKLKTNYPAYYEYKYAIKQPSIKEIQEQLPEGKALLEYFIGKESVHLYTFTQDKVDYLNLKISNKEIQEKVEELRKELSDYGYINTNRKLAKESYQKLSHWFYKELLEPALSKIPTIHELIIVPDGLLGHIPFEAFLLSPPAEEVSFQELNYLLRAYKISYAYSASLILPSTTTSSNAKSGVLGMGASYNELNEKYLFPKNRSDDLQRIREALRPLSAVKEEIKALEVMFDGSYYYGEAANEKKFKEEASNFAVLHLAMHGILNEQYPILSNLAFTENGIEEEDNFLQAFEISQLKLNAELVVLSACETGYGKFQQGEGVMSLARSFMFAGVPAMVVSMWQVNDLSTALVMKVFYQNLAKGMDKAEALQQAKLTYIDNAKGLSAHPAFWAPFIQLGNTDPVNIFEKGANKLIWLIGIFALVGGVLLVLIRRKKRSLS